MRKTKVCIAAFSAITLLQVVVSASPITVLNHSFESPAVGDGSYAIGADSWSGSSFGIQDWTDTQYTGTSGNTQNIPGADGYQGIWINSGGVAYQDVGALVANTTYTLTVAVGNRADKGYDTSLIALGFYQDNLSTPLSVSGSLGGGLTGGAAHSDVSYQFTTGASVSGNLVIALDNASLTSQTNVDNVRLDAIPEPATLGLVSIFGACVLFVRRRLMI